MFVSKLFHRRQNFSLSMLFLSDFFSQSIQQLCVTDFYIFVNQSHSCIFVSQAIVRTNHRYTDIHLRHLCRPITDIQSCIVRYFVDQSQASGCSPKFTVWANQGCMALLLVISYWSSVLSLPQPRSTLISLVSIIRDSKLIRFN